MEKEYKIRVIIAGGGVAGLTLANALEQAGIDFLLLERRNEIAPNIGQSIASEPNGARILDQLGILPDWLQHSQACTYWIERDSNGELLFKSDGLQLTKARFGYDLDFGERKAYLSTLYRHIKDKSKVLVGKGIVSVDQSENGVTVKCEDGSSYEGDILAGADGVRSKVRQEIWRLANSEEPDLVERDKKALFAEYKCLFGIAHLPPGPTPGDFDVGFDTHKSSLVFAGPNGQSYYFVFEKLDKIYRGNDIPRFTHEDAVAFGEKYRNLNVRPGLPFSKWWEKSKNFTLTCTEEGKFELWTWGRIACLGDSIHKMTPNIGVGGNCGIESAAAFANAIKSIVDKSDGKQPSQELVEEELKAYHNARKSRANRIVGTSGVVTRFQASRNLNYRFQAWISRRHPGDFIAEILSGYFSDAVMLNYLPPPKASLKVLQGFNPTQGDSHMESKLKRAFFALPFLAAFYFFFTSMDATIAIAWIMDIIKAGKVSWDTGSAPIRSTFYQIKQLDELWVPINVFFTPVIYEYDSSTRSQTMTFLADFGVIIAIWAFESVRRANVLTLATVPTLFMILGQLRGIGIICPLYYFFYWVYSPIGKFLAFDLRLGRVNYALALLPTLLLVYYLPLYGMLEWSTLTGRESWLFFWQMYPIWMSLGTFLLTRFIPDTNVSDRYVPKRDLPVIIYTIGTLSVLSSIVWIWTAMSSPNLLTFASWFTPETLPIHTQDFVTFTREFLKFDEVSLFSNTFLWLAYCFWDLKSAGMVQTGWPTLLFYLVSSVAVLGPGATAGLGWLWREYILATKRHKDAVTDENITKPVHNVETLKQSG